VSEQHGPVWRVGRQVGGQVSGIRGRAPLDLVALHIGAECLRDLGESVAKAADGDGQHPIPRREGVDHGRLQRTGAGAGQQEDLAVRPDQAGDAGRGLAQHLAELGAAMVDHRRRLRLEHGVRDRRGAGNAQVLLHGDAS
jgi:hypothetical protein